LVFVARGEDLNGGGTCFSKQHDTRRAKRGLVAEPRPAVLRLSEIRSEAKDERKT